MGDDVYEDYPDDEERNIQDPVLALKIAGEIRELGNKLFKEGKVEDALAKYQSQPIVPLCKMILVLILASPSKESIRYLDVHPVMPDNSPPELQDSYNSLLAPVLLNSALAALKVQPQTSNNAQIAVDNSSRAMDRLTLNKADMGKYYLSVALTDVLMDSHLQLFCL